MKREILVTGNNLWIPIACKQKSELFTVSDKGGRIYEFLVPVGECRGNGYLYDYFASIPIAAYEGSCIILEGKFPEEFFESIRLNQPPELYQSRPMVHFTADTGWIGKPNNMVYADGVYHLYFQYNPFDTERNNVNCGHAVSRDLLHWEQKKDELLLFDTAAGDSNAESAWDKCTWRITNSTDGGSTLCKSDKAVLPAIEKQISESTDRVLMIPYFQTKNIGKYYKGSFGIPREVSIVKNGEDSLLKQELPAEWKNARKEVLHRTAAGGRSVRVYYIPEGRAAYEIVVRIGTQSPVTWNLFREEAKYDPETGIFCFAGQKKELAPGLKGLTLIYDSGILEVCDESCTMMAYFEVLDTIENNNLGEIGILGDELDEVRIYEVK